MPFRPILGSIMFLFSISLVGVFEIGKAIDK
jgi:hypothetical protein